MSSAYDSDVFSASDNQRSAHESAEDGRQCVTANGAGDVSSDIQRLIYGFADRHGLPRRFNHGNQTEEH
ncbi:hypothetical protein D3C75_1078840 [compost metagenome]